MFVDYQGNNDELEQDAYQSNQKVVERYTKTFDCIIYTAYSSNVVMFRILSLNLACTSNTDPEVRHAVVHDPVNTGMTQSKQVMG